MTRIDAYERNAYLRVSGEETYTVLEVKRSGGLLKTLSGYSVHDIVIRDNHTRKIYLHSSPFVKEKKKVCPCCHREM